MGEALQDRPCSLCSQARSATLAALSFSNQYSREEGQEAGGAGSNRSEILPASFSSLPSKVGGVDDGECSLVESAQRWGVLSPSTPTS